jgi:hypothetical protein
MPPRKAQPASFPPEAFELFVHFPKYPSSGTRDDQLAFIADKLNEEPPFPQALYDLWCNFYDEYPIFAKRQEQEDRIVSRMRTWWEWEGSEK